MEENISGSKPSLSRSGSASSNLSSMRGSSGMQFSRKEKPPKEPKVKKEKPPKGAKSPKPGYPSGQMPPQGGRPPMPGHPAGQMPPQGGRRPVHGYPAGQMPPQGGRPPMPRYPQGQMPPQGARPPMQGRPAGQVPQGAGPVVPEPSLQSPADSKSEKEKSGGFFGRKKKNDGSTEFPDSMSGNDLVVTIPNEILNSPEGEKTDENKASEPVTPLVPATSFTLSGPVPEEENSDKDSKEPSEAASKEEVKITEDAVEEKNISDETATEDTVPRTEESTPPETVPPETAPPLYERNVYMAPPIVNSPKSIARTASPAPVFLDPDKADVLERATKTEDRSSRRSERAKTDRSSYGRSDTQREKRRDRRESGRIQPDRREIVARTPIRGNDPSPATSASRLGVRSVESSISDAPVKNIEVRHGASLDQDRNTPSRRSSDGELRRESHGRRATDSLVFGIVPRATMSLIFLIMLIAVTCICSAMFLDVRVSILVVIVLIEVIMGIFLAQAPSFVSIMIAAVLTLVGALTGFLIPVCIGNAIMLSAYLVMKGE